MPRLLPVGFPLLLAVAAHAQQPPATAPLAPDSLVGASRERIIKIIDPADSITLTARTYNPTFTTMQPALSRVAGVQVTPYSGAPGAGAVVRIRGVASLDSNVQPLYVVDGVPVYQYRFGSASGQDNGIITNTSNADASSNPLLSIAPEDIERIEVLKGAFETGQYGFLGQNGVVRITTRQGAAGQPLRVHYAGWGGVQQARTRYQLLGAREAAELTNEAARNNGYAPEYTPAQLAGFGQGTDWQAELLRTAATQEHHLSADGSTPFGTRYYAAVDYLDQTGIALNSGLRRYSLRLTLSQALGPHLVLSGGVSYADVQERRLYASTFSQALRYMPTVPVYAANGDYATDNGAPNPVQWARQNFITPRNRRLLAHGQVRYELVPGLTLDLRASLERDSLAAHDYQSLRGRYVHEDGFETGSRGAYHQQVIVNPALRFARTLGRHHAVAASAEYTAWKNDNAQGFAAYSPDLPPFSLPTRISSSWYQEGYNLRGYQFQASYAYARRYALQGSLRADESSRVPPDAKRQWLPAAQATWHAGREEWLQGHALSTLDAWAGWSRTSNRGNFSGDHGFTINIGNSVLFQFLDELTTQTDAGLQVGLWHDHLTLTSAVYRRQTRANLVYFGHQLPVQARSQGLELTLTGTWQAGRLSGSTSVAASTNATRYDAPDNPYPLNYRPGTNYYILQLGQPLSTFTGLQYLGVDAAGNPRFAPRTQENGALGSGLPRQLLSLTQQLRYGRFDLQLQVDGMFGADVLDPNLGLLDVPSGGFNATTRVRDRWTPAHPNTDVPRAGASRNGLFGNASTYTLQSGNHVRLSSAVLTAEVWRQAPHSVFVFLSGTNLLLLSAYRGYDPNVSGAEADGRQAGLDPATYPTARTVALGVRATF